MNIYKARIKVHGRMVTPLRADTIFGHIAWGIARHEGAEALEAFLDSFETSPSLIVSSAFPEGCLPMPQLYRDKSSISDTYSYSSQKKAKRIKYVPVSVFNDAHPVMRRDLVDAVSKLRDVEYVEQTLHNTVDRLGRGTLDEVGLFQTRETWLLRRNPQNGELEPATLDIYILSEFSSDRLTAVLGWAFEAGFGAKSSTGAGHVVLLGIEATTLPTKGNRAMALAPFVLTNPAEVDDLRADIFIRHGMLGHDFGLRMNPYKKPILFFDEGASFTPVHEKSYIGSMVGDIHEDKRIRQHGYAPIFRFEDGGQAPEYRRSR